MGKSQDKGSGFEREISKDLSRWLTDGKDEFIYNRRSGSGGAGRDKAGQSGSGGDIYADKPEGKWLTDHTMFELKSYKDLKSQLWRFICGETSQLDEFIDQARESADVYERTWSLIFKCNFCKPLFLTNSEVIGAVITAPVSIIRQGEQLYLFPVSSFLSEHPNKLQSLVAQSLAK